MVNPFRQCTPRSTIVVLALTVLATAFAQSPPAGQSGNTVIVRVGRLLDVRSGTYLKEAAIYIEGDRINAVGPAIEVMKQAPAASRIVDLGDATALPGLIDCHTHIMARVPEEEHGYGYGLNLLTKSQAYRALEGAANARVTLEAGFTTCLLYTSPSPRD